MRLSPGTLERRFSLARLWLLLRNRLYDEAPVFAIGAAIVLGVNALGLVFAKTAFFNSSSGRAATLWILTIVVAGLLQAGTSLKAMHDGRGETDWILLPATGIEKYGAALVDSIVVFPLAAAAAGIALSALLALVEGLIGGPGNPLWLPGMQALKAWGGYAIAATVFVAGSASFRKAAFLKTGGLVLAFSFVWTLAVALIVFLLMDGRWGSGFSLSNGRFFAEADSVISRRALGFMQTATDIAVYAAIPAFAILFGAAKVVEKEAKDEVQ
jgi:hypothetical protein